MLIPQSPAFQTDSERQIWTLLADSLEPGEVLFHGLRFTDPKDGDIEIDLLLLSPQRGAAIIEVKGGLVRYQEGQWTLSTNGGSSRRIHPVEQARRAKHALRRYLDRSPEWEFGLLRSQWYLALPHTPVDGDLGPQAPRERVIGEADVPNLRQIINDGLRDAPREPSVPDSDWVPLAVELIQNAPESSHSAERFGRAHSFSGHGFASALALISLGVAVLLGSLIAFTYAGPWGLVAAAVLLALSVLVGYRLTKQRARIPLWVALVVTIVALIAGGLGGLQIRGGGTSDQVPLAVTPITRDTAQAAGIDPASLPCSLAYRPCVREVPWNRNCDDIGFRVALTGIEDPYGLDRNGDGIGCASFPESSSGEE